MEILFLAFSLTKTNCPITVIRHRTKTQSVSVNSSYAHLKRYEPWIDNWVWDDKDLKYLVEFTTYTIIKEIKNYVLFSVGGGGVRARQNEK